MAVVDMPLEKLWEYKGTNPRPKDFDQFWADALDELSSVDPKPEMKKAGFETKAAVCYDLYYNSVRGGRIYAKLLIPKGAKKDCPGVCHFHGYTGRSGSWPGYLGWASEGFVTAAMDCRGQGGASNDPCIVEGTTYKGHIIRGLDDKPENLAFRQIYLDTVQLARVVMGLDEVDETKVCAAGGSQGGGLTLACAGLEKRIWKIAPQVPFLCDYQRVWEMDLETDPYSELKYFFRQFDPLHEREAMIFERLGYIDGHHLAKRIEAQTLIALTLRDNICPPSSQFAAFNAIPAKKEAMVFPDFAHEVPPLADDRIFQFFREGV